MIDFIKTKRNYIIALSILFVLVSLSDTTYSLFLQSESTEEFTYNTGLLDLQFIEDEQMSLQNAFPMNDSEALALTPYKLTIKNTGSLAYYFDLTMSPSEKDDAISDKYIKFKVNDDIPSSLAYAENIISKNNIIYPGEELTFKINIWLDINTPNTELGKTFTAKVITSGTSIYKTLDNSGANHPVTNDDMVPVYYADNSWKVADKSNLIENNKWYNYNDSLWANSVVLNSSDKLIFDITRNNDLKIKDVTFNDGNAIIDEQYLDIGLSNYKYNNISNIFRIKFNKLNNSKIYIISNGNITYYYNNTTKKFVFEYGNEEVTSNNYILEENKWYILGYTYDSNKVNFYIGGSSIGSATIDGQISSSNSFKIGTDNINKEVSPMIVGNVLIYNRILSTNEISKNYKTSVETIYDGLLSGYEEFIPMTLKEYYSTRKLGTKIRTEDISAFYVWIPRFKYQVWNVLGDNNTDTYDAHNKGINIIFENGTAKTGNIHCKKYECFSDSNYENKVDISNNNQYYTHPAFTNSNEELTGLWVSKYEVSIDNNKIKSIPNTNVWRNNNLSNYYQNIKNISENNDYHVIKNTEWGAIAYLTHSKYGLCQNNKCTLMESNNQYLSGANPKDSTTGNITGVFDMAGSANEYTMANISNDEKINLSNTTFGDMPISNDDYDLYKNNTFILGDATKEISSNNITLNNDNNWIIRGSITSDNLSRIFSYISSKDVSSESISTRIVTK